MRVSPIVVAAFLGVAGLATVEVAAWRESRSLRAEFAAHRAALAQSQAAREVRERALRQAVAQADAARVRLLAIPGLSPKESEAVRAVARALEADGLAPAEYFASFRAEGPTLIFELRHDRHPSNPREAGDVCGKCRTAIYNSTGRTVRLFGVR